MKEAGRQVYFQDVKLQMDAKLWGEEYNKHKPPKKVLVWRKERERGGRIERRGEREVLGP